MRSTIHAVCWGTNRMMVFAGKLVCRWKYVGNDPEPPIPIGPPGKDGVGVLVNCLRLHTAMGEQAKAVLERFPCRNDDATRVARRGRFRKDCDTSMTAAVIEIMNEMVGAWTCLAAERSRLRAPTPQQGPIKVRIEFQPSRDASTIIRRGQIFHASNSQQTLVIALIRERSIFLYYLHNVLHLLL